MWKRVVAPTLLVIVFWGSINIATTLYIRWMNRSQERILSENVMSIRAAGEMLELLWRMQAVASDRNSVGHNRNGNELVMLQKQFDNALDVAERTASLPQITMTVQMIRERFATYQRTLLEESQFENDRDRMAPSSANTLELAAGIAAPCKELLEMNQRVIAESSASQSRFVSTISTIRTIAIIVGPALGLILGVVVSRNLHRSISQIRVMLQEAPGEKSHQLGQIEVSSNSDLPELHQMVQDLVSRMRETVRELQQVRRDVVQSERLAAVGELAAGVAHELRNPLTSVKLLVQTAMNRGSNGALGERPLQIVVDEIARMEKTIQGLLDFARPPSLQRIRHDLRETLQRSLNLVAGRAQQQSVTIVEDLPQEAVLLNADPDQLQQVFVNLLINGIESMPDGGTLNVTIDEPRDGICRTRFTDCGIGIPAPILDHMFEPFVTSKMRGTGLGLAVSRRIVLEHGGALLATNRESKGAIFTVELPYSTPQIGTEPVIACLPGTRAV